MIQRTINGRTVSFTMTEPHFSHHLFTCPECGTYTFVTHAGGNLRECPDDCPNHPHNNPFPDYEIRYFAEVEYGHKTLRELSGSPEPTEPGEDGFYRRTTNNWIGSKDRTTDGQRELFVPGTGWVKV